MGTTRIGEGRSRISITLDDDLLNAVDKIAGEMGVTRSAIIEGCIESGLEDLRLLRYLGLSPRRLASIARGLQRLGVIKAGSVEVDCAKAEDQLRERGIRE